MRKCLLVVFCIALVFQSSCFKEDKYNSTPKQDLLTVTPSQTPTTTPTINYIEMTNSNDSDNTSMNSNPIDEWYLKICDQYGNSHSYGFISYLYGKAWKAELQHLLKDYSNTQIAEKYFNAVEKEEAAINELMIEREKVDWSTGSSGRISLACAVVYKNAVYQLDQNYFDFIFDSEKATQAYLNQTELN